MRFFDKAFAYITRPCINRQGSVLVFEHVDFKEAGLQVPAGTVHDDESPGAAVVREAREETGLERFQSVVFLGSSDFDVRPFGKDELHRRHFFQLPLAGPAPERWRHFEDDPSDGSTERIELELYWLPFTVAARELAAGHGRFLDRL